jgi:Na+-driven multidrug efflux pump
MFVSMMTTAIAVRKYGIESLSLVILAMQVASYAQLIEVGIPTSMSRRLPRYLVNADIPMINAVCSSSLVMLIAGSIALILALPAFAMRLPRLLAIGNDELKTIGLLFGLVVFFTAMQLPLRISYGIFSSMHRFSTYFTLETLSAIAKLIIIVALFSMFVPPLWLYIVAALVPPLIIGSIEFTSGSPRKEN